jgi:hypothetical protein
VETVQDRVQTVMWRSSSWTMTYSSAPSQRARVRTHIAACMLRAATPPRPRGPPHELRRRPGALRRSRNPTPRRENATATDGLHRHRQCGDSLGMAEWRKFAKAEQRTILNSSLSSATGSNRYATTRRHASRELTLRHAAESNNKNTHTPLIRPPSQLCRNAVSHKLRQQRTAAHRSEPPTFCNPSPWHAPHPSLLPSNLLCSTPRALAASNDKR